MKKFENKNEAFASQNYDPNQVVITGVPEHHVEALKAAANLFVMHDAVNEKKLDFTDSSGKYSIIHEMGSPSGVGFAFGVCDFWFTGSGVGARLSSESREAALHIDDLCKDDYKTLKVYDRKI